MRAGRVLRQIVIARIKAQVPDLGGRVYDKATEGTVHPYASMGPSDAVNESVECIRAKNISLQIDIWHGKVNKGVVEDLVDDAFAALDGYEDTSLLTMHPIEVVQTQVMDDPSDGFHGIVRIEVDVESNG